MGKNVRVQVGTALCWSLAIAIVAAALIACDLIVGIGDTQRIGSEGVCAERADCPVDLCWAATCQGNRCDYAPIPSGIPCGQTGQKCNGAGSCVDGQPGGGGAGGVGGYAGNAPGGFGGDPCGCGGAGGGPQLELEATADGTIDEAFPILNDADAEFLTIHSWNPSTAQNKRIVISFASPGFPRGGTVCQAQLCLYYFSAGSTDMDVSVHRITAAWNESLVSWAMRTTESWTAGGGDFETAATDQIALEYNKPAGEPECWDTTQDVKWFLSYPENNYGWVVKATDEQTGNGEMATFASRHQSTWPKPVLQIWLCP